MTKYFYFIRLSLLLLLLFAGCQTAPAKTPSLLKPPVTLLNLEKELHREINRVRQGKGLLPLTWDPHLKIIAKQHSQEMLEMNYFDHFNPAGETPTERGLKNNYVCRIIEGELMREGLAENLFKTSLYEFKTVQGAETNYEWRTNQQIINNIISKWLESPGHRKNMLHQDYQKTGIGISLNDNYEIWITQDFC